MVCNIYEKWCVPFSFLCYTKHSVDLKGETNNMKEEMHGRYTQLIS